MSPVAGLVIAYLLGSVPAAYIAGRALKGIDLREHGSGNLGATNVLRVLGARTAIVVFLFDVLKGALPVLVLSRVVPATTRPELWAIGYGVAAIVGHVRPIFLLWKGGGKGVATATGVFAALTPLPMLFAFGTFVLVVAATRFVSLGSLCAAVVLPIAILAFEGVHTPVFVISLIVATFVFWTHRANIGRLSRGEESRIGHTKVPG